MLIPSCIIILLLILVACHVLLPLLNRRIARGRCIAIFSSEILEIKVEWFEQAHYQFISAEFLFLFHITANLSCLNLYSYGFMRHLQCHEGPINFHKKHNFYKKEFLEIRTRKYTLDGSKYWPICLLSAFLNHL
jgi:hypothetical protein